MKKPWPPVLPPDFSRSSQSSLLAFVSCQNLLLLFFLLIVCFIPKSMPGAWQIAWQITCGYYWQQWCYSVYSEVTNFMCHINGFNILINVTTIALISHTPQMIWDGTKIIQISCEKMVYCYCLSTFLSFFPKAFFASYSIEGTITSKPFLV